MKKYFLLFLFGFQLLPAIYAHWQPANGPYGGNINGLIINGQNIFALSNPPGVFLSTDNGNNWSPRNNGITNYYVTCIAVKGNRTYTGTASGLFISDDDGATWNTVLINGLANYQVKAIASNAQSVFILVGDTLYRSNDNGGTWNKLMNNQYLYTIGINGNTIFIGGATNLLYRSVNNGDNFLSIDLSSLGDLYFLGSFTFSGSNIFATGQNGMIYKSTDNGDTWNQAITGISVPAAISLTSNGNKIYAGLYNGEMGYPYITGTGGIYVSQDDGAHWTSLGLTGFSVEKIIFSGNRMIAGTLLAGIVVSDDGGLTWNSSNNGLVRLPVWAIAQNGSDLFVSSASLAPYGSTYEVNVLKSSDHGQNWIKSDSGLSNMPVSVFAVGSSFMLAGGTALYISYNNGLTWHSIFSPGYTINALLISGSNIFVGTNSGIFLSPDGGISWHSVNNGLENPTVLSMISRGNAIFAGTSSGVFRSLDNGSTWVAARNGIEGYSIPAMTSNTNYLFASGTSYSPGIFRSADNGDHWFRANIDFSIFTYVNSLAAINEKIFAGTSDFVSQVLFSADNGGTWSVTRTGLPVNFQVPALVILDSVVYAALDVDFSYSSTGSGVWKRPVSDFIPFALSGDTVIMQETAGDLKTLGITSETPWNIDGTLPAWLVVDKNSGSGSDVLTFTTTQANPDQQPRYTSLDVVSLGASRHVTVVQKQKLNGIDDPSMRTVSIFPNPTSGSIIIESTALYDKLTIYSAPGQLLYEQAVVSAKTRIDLSRYGRGVYYIRLSGEKGFCIREVIVL